MKQPSSAQLSHLRRLADQRGVTFVTPTSMVGAMKEIDRLKTLPMSTSSERAMERDLVTETRREYLPASSVRDFEVDGYGSSCHWV